MKPTAFPYDAYLAKKQEKEQAFLRFLNAEQVTDVPVLMRSPKLACFGAMCQYRDKSLENQLDALEDYLHFKSDFWFSYLEPWHGVGIYAAAFGCPFKWSDYDAPQTLPIYNTIADIAHFKKPNMDCEQMNMVVDTIRYFRKETNDLIDVIVTDTQSPIDNASIIMDACEFFTASIIEPEALEEFLDVITEATIAFTHRQQEAAGKALAQPGHLMLPAPGIGGLAISDDNLAICSPASYRATAVPSNTRLAKEFGGLGVHTCGSYIQNIPELLSIKGLRMVDCAIGRSIDPTPNDPAKLKAGFKGSGKLLKVRLKFQEIELLRELVDPDVKLVVEMCDSGTHEEMIEIYDKTKTFVLSLLNK